MTRPFEISRRGLLSTAAGAAVLSVAGRAKAAGKTLNFADIGVGDPGGDWSGFTKASGWNVNLVAIGNAPSAILNVMIGGGGTSTYDIINIVGGMQPPLISNHLIEAIDPAEMPDWAKDTYISEYLTEGKPGFQFIGYQGRLYGVPSVLQGDAFAYLPEKTGPLDSYAALFDPKWRGYVALENNYTTAGQKTALYLKKAGLADIKDPANMSPAEIKAVVDFLIGRKKGGQFRVLWSSFEQAVDLIVRKEVYVIDCWEPMVFAAAAKGVHAVYADPKEGYLLWAMAAYLVNKRNGSAAEKKASYELLNFMLGGWYGAKITLLRGYMTNPLAPAYAASHPAEFTAAEAKKIAAITANVKHKFDQGGTWQNRWPTHIDAYESEWQRFEAA
ncbi:MAG: extracellular solute-binding protein [Rhodospirillales bacterium]|nr:extracellular solute-binding protein [Rhodospirillales bacterium]